MLGLGGYDHVVPWNVGDLQCHELNSGMLLCRSVSLVFSTGQCTGFYHGLTCTDNP